MAINDFYFGDDDFPWPMGNLQLLGKLQAGMLPAAKPYIPKSVLTAMADRSIDWWVMSEDLPDPDNRVFPGGDAAVRVQWKPNNRVAHRQLIKRAVNMMRAAGYPLVFTETLGIDTNSHQCGTARFRTGSTGVGARSHLQNSRNRQSLRDGFVFLPLVDRHESGADHFARKRCA